MVTRKSAAGTVALGIFASRMAGFVRERIIAHYLGVGALSDVLQAALRGPNLLQNLLGEGTLSASFIPVYSRLLEAGRRDEAGRLAGAVFSLLVCVAGGIALLGFLFAEPLVALLTPGFSGDAARVAAGEMSVDRFPLAVAAVRWIFPMAGLLVLAAWCLGVLNSHRRFLVPYLAPVAWSAAIIAGLVYGARQVAGGEAPSDRLLLAACAGALVGGALQLAVQLPFVVGLLRGFRLSLSPGVPGLPAVLRAFGPAVAGRGVYQLSSYLDNFLASFLVAGALSGQRYAQFLYLLPISLFGMAVAASELPELARLGEAGRKRFVERLDGSLRQMLFLVLPTVLGYWCFGLLLVGGLFRTGEFDAVSQQQVYLVLCAYTLGLPATATSRLFQNSFFALGDTKTPARIAGARLLISLAVGIPAMLLLDRIALGEGSQGPLFLGVAGLALGSAAGAWGELGLLRRRLQATMPDFRLPWSGAGGMVLAALLAAVLPALLWYFLPPSWPLALAAALVVGLYGGSYLGIAWRQRRPELRAWLGRFAP
ncbi:MAG: murein biosynthesis integral membrane protein MurJ [Acidobacteriota bacterium]